MSGLVVKTSAGRSLPDHVAYIGLGSNIGDGVSTLRKAWDLLGSAENISLVHLASPYFSAPVGMTSSNWFTNSVGCLVTKLAPLGLLDQLLAVEKHFGRTRDPEVLEYQDRTLDLDLLYYDTVCMSQERLTLPHPLLGSRLFVLEPFAEIAGDFQDPEDRMSIIEKRDRLVQQMAAGEVAMQRIERGSWQRGKNKFQIPE